MADDNDYDEQDQDQEKDRNWRRDLERRARDGDEAKKRVAELERREAFREAGLDLTKPAVGYFVKGYDGELTSEAIKAAAQEAGFLEAPGDAANTDTAGEAHPAQGVLDQITQAAGASTPGGVDPRAEMEKAYDAGGVEAMLDVVQKLGVPVTTRQ